MIEGAFDPFRVLRTLERHGVRFVLIGGLGARLHGSPSVTNDTDICYERTADNMKRLAAALRQLGATLRGVPDETPFRPDAATLSSGDHFTFSTKGGNLDCLGPPAGVGGFDELADGAEVFDVEGLSVRVASIGDLIRMKRAAGRPKDLIEVEVLAALQSEIEAGTEGPRSRSDEHEGR
jgi:hypothetical protein